MKRQRGKHAQGVNPKGTGGRLSSFARPLGISSDTKLSNIPHAPICVSNDARMPNTPRAPNLNALVYPIQDLSTILLLVFSASRLGTLPEAQMQEAAWALVQHYVPAQPCGFSDVALVNVYHKWRLFSPREKTIWRLDDFWYRHRWRRPWYIYM